MTGLLAGHLQNVVTVNESMVGGIVTLLDRVISVHGLDVVDHDKYAACEDKYKGDDAEHPDSIETKEDV